MPSEKKVSASGDGTSTVPSAPEVFLFFWLGYALLNIYKCGGRVGPDKLLWDGVKSGHIGNRVTVTVEVFRMNLLPFVDS